MNAQDKAESGSESLSWSDIEGNASQEDGTSVGADALEMPITSEDVLASANDVNSSRIALDASAPPGSNANTFSPLAIVTKLHGNDAINLSPADCCTACDAQSQGAAPSRIPAQAPGATQPTAHAQPASPQVDAGIPKATANVQSERNNAAARAISAPCADAGIDQPSAAAAAPAPQVGSSHPASAAGEAAGSSGVSSPQTAAPAGADRSQSAGHPQAAGRSQRPVLQLFGRRLMPRQRLDQQNNDRNGRLQPIATDDFTLPLPAAGSTSEDPSDAAIANAGEPSASGSDSVRQAASAQSLPLEQQLEGTRIKPHFAPQRPLQSPSSSAALQPNQKDERQHDVRQHATATSEGATAGASMHESTLPGQQQPPVAGPKAPVGGLQAHAQQLATTLATRLNLKDSHLGEVSESLVEGQILLCLQAAP